MDDCKELISGLPLASIEYAFAYGSGAIQQQDERKEEKMVDFILCTNDPLSFHHDNIKINPSHYSLIRIAGAKILAGIQTKLGAHVYYNTNVRVGKRVIKYGVIGTECLKQDLLDWRWLYVAGRLHKPVVDVITPTDQIAENVTQNRRSALQAALLLLPDVFPLYDLFQNITKLSYSGDFRMMIAEDRNKIKKIVDGSYEEFQKVYEPLLAEDARLVLQNGKVLQDVSGTAIYHRLNLLPSTVLGKIQRDWNKKHRRQQDCEEVLFSLAHRHDVTTTVEEGIANIVKRPALTQTAKNAFSAGLTNSIIYSLAKISKKLKSR
ncbi:unnamed protein product [Auanema sp. JU1783]|nr:unnamed protein product [Auanema sp. JU1783]